MNRKLFRRRSLRSMVVVLAAGAVFFCTASLNVAQDGGGSTRQPIVGNQFTTTSGGALQARAPGNYIQQAVGVQEGTLNPFDGNVPDDTSFARETFDMLALQFIDIITNLVDSLTALVGNPLGGLGGGGSNPLLNLLTNGGLGSTPIS